MEGASLWNKSYEDLEHVEAISSLRRDTAERHENLQTILYQSVDVSGRTLLISPQTP